MNRIWVLTLLLAVAPGLTGCDDDFLTTVPTDRIPDERFWKTPQDAVLAVNAAYTSVWGVNIMYFDGASDNGYSAKYWMRNSPYANGIQDATTAWHTDLWAGAYTGISRANEVLEKIDQIPALDPQLRDRLEGEARFLRAYYYNNLVNLFGDVPLILKLLTIAESRSITRTALAAVVDQILSDLDYATGVLPTSYPQADRGRATQGAALALKARAALYAASWARYHDGNEIAASDLYRSAAEAARAVMDLGVYSLYPDYRNLFTYQGESSAEVIFERQAVKNLSGWWAWAGFAPRSAAGNSDVVPTRSLVDAYRMIDGLPIDQSPLYDPTNPYQNRDPRFHATILYPGAPCSFCDPPDVFNSLPQSPTADGLDQSDFESTHTGYKPLKYIDPADKSDRWNSGLNFILIRYADVLLMYAEAKIELGEIDGTVTDAVNQVRRRAGMPDVTATTQVELREIARNERRVELAWEGLRFFDIRRWKIAEQVMPGKVYGIDYVEDGVAKRIEAKDTRRFTAPRDYLWPIPSKEIELVPTLVQNPGY